MGFFLKKPHWIRFALFWYLVSRRLQSNEICLNMIVKNEAAVIERCLASVRAHIDHWVIVDTGSTDGTQALVRDALKDVPGTLFERPWVHFGHNRSEALALAQSHGDYLLFTNFPRPQVTFDNAQLLSRLPIRACRHRHLGPGKRHGQSCRRGAQHGQIQLNP